MQYGRNLREEALQPAVLCENAVRGPLVLLMSHF